MARIDATITATDEGGKFNAVISPNPISVSRGQHQIAFALDDQTTNGPTKFDTDDPIFYATGNSCPSSGKNSAALDVVSCTDDLLTVDDDNGAAEQIGYRLNFLYGAKEKKEDLDPIIINR